MFQVHLLLYFLGKMCQPSNAGQPRLLGRTILKISRCRLGLELGVKGIGKGKAEILEARKTGKHNKQGCRPNHNDQKRNEVDDVDRVLAALGTQIAFSDIEGQVQGSGFFPAIQKISVFNWILAPFEGVLYFFDIVQGIIQIEQEFRYPPQLVPRTLGQFVFDQRFIGGDASMSSFAVSVGKILRYTFAIERSVVTFTLETEISVPRIPPSMAACCKMATISFWMTPAILRCLCVSMAQKYTE